MRKRAHAKRSFGLRNCRYTRPGGWSGTRYPKLLLADFSTTGFDATHVAYVGPIDIPGSDAASETAKLTEMERIVRAVRALPGVQNGGWGYSIPFSPSRMGSSVAIDGQIFAKGLEPESLSRRSGRASLKHYTRRCLRAGRSLIVIGLGLCRLRSSTRRLPRGFSQTVRFLANESHLDLAPRRPLNRRGA